MSAPPRSPPSPFSPAPSARPPRASAPPPPVRVPAPGSAPHALPLSPVATPFGASPAPLPEQRRLDLAETERLFMPPIPAAPAVPREGEPPPQPRTRKMDPTVRTRPVEVGSRSPVRAILFIGGVVVVLILVAGFVVRSVRARRAATSAKQAAAAASESVPETAAIAPATAAPVVIDAGVVAFVDGPDAAPDLRPFDKQVARAALDAASAKLADCRVPKGKPVKVKVTFTPQGSVSAASPLAPHGAQKACVAGHLKEVRIASFQGSAHTAVYALTVPKNP